MLPAPRIIAVDDELKHLNGLSDGLNAYGAACLKICFTGNGGDIKPCPYVRVIFADLHLTVGAGDDDAKHYAVIGGLIEQDIKPAGPYIIVLWTAYPEKAGNLQQYLANRLQGPKPFAVVALDKNVHLDADGKVKDVKQLFDAIMAIVMSQPQIAALLTWEEHILGAAAETVSAMMTLAATIGDPAKTGAELARLLGHLAKAAVGEENVDQDRFHAVNEALLPILADHVATLKANERDTEVWKNAFSVGAATALSSSEAAKLNHLVHIADATTSVKGCDRGAVIELPAAYTGNAFATIFGMTPEIAAKECFRSKNYVTGNESFRWVLIQVEAACDFAQKQPGPLPFHLGLEMVTSSISRNTPPRAIWTSPEFELNGSTRVLCVHSRFHITRLATEMEGIKPVYRLREQLLNELLYHIHTHEARPGRMSFREEKEEKGAQAVPALAKPAKAVAAEATEKTAR